MDSVPGESGETWSYDPNDRIGDPSGMGQVFRGSGRRQPVAVKKVALRLDSAGERRRREREVEIAKVLAAVPTEHLLPTLDTARVGDDLFIVMPLAQRSLAAALKAADLDGAARFDACRQIAQGLVELAGASVLHRDLKPENILEHEGRWQLADFGIARSLLEATGTYTFLGWGTWPYMAPELWSGQPATVKTDLYALGVIAFEVLAGSRPFPGPDEADYRRQHQLEPPPLLPAKVTPALGRLVLRLLAKNPAERPQDARAVLEGLDAALKRMTPVQDQLAEAALSAQVRRSAEEVQSARLAAQQLSAESEREQALADLKQILEDAADLAREALPDLKFTGNSLEWHLMVEDAFVGVVPWLKVPSVPGLAFKDPLVVVGVVYSNPPSSYPRANIACEHDGDRLVWNLLRFRANAIAGSNYVFGPLDRQHGFDEWTFADQRPYMLNPMTHVWTMEKWPLTPDAVIVLLTEAIAAV